MLNQSGGPCEGAYGSNPTGIWLHGRSGHSDIRRTADVLEFYVYCAAAPETRSFADFAQPIPER